MHEIVDILSKENARTQILFLQHFIINHLAIFYLLST